MNCVVQGVILCHLADTRKNRLWPRDQRHSEMQHAGAFKKIMKRRPAVERMIKIIKYDYGDRRAHKRGNAAFQAFLDKIMIAIHIQLRHDHG